MLTSRQFSNTTSRTYDDGVLTTLPLHTSVQFLQDKSKKPLAPVLVNRFCLATIVTSSKYIWLPLTDDKVIPYGTVAAMIIMHLSREVPLNLRLRFDANGVVVLIV